MAINSVAEERAKYKSMLINWLIGLGILTFLHYFIILVFNVNSGLVSSLSDGVESGDYMKDIFTKIWTTAGFVRSMGYGILYTSLSLIVFIYLVVYIKRMLMVCFLIMIAPLVSITYAVDKSGNNRSEILNTWVKTFSYNVLIQPFHCILYLVFVNQSISLLNRSSVSDIGSAVLAIVSMFGIFIGEKIIKTIFGFNKGNTIASKMIATTLITNSITTIRQQVENINKANEEETSNMPDIMPDGSLTENSIRSNANTKDVPEFDEDSDDTNPKKRIPVRSSGKDPIRSIGQFYGGMVGAASGARLAKNIGGAISNTARKKYSREEMFLLASAKYKNAMGLTDEELKDRMNLLARMDIKDLTDGRDIAYKMWIDSTKNNLENQGNPEALETMEDLIIGMAVAAIVNEYSQNEDEEIIEEEEVPVASIKIEPSVVNMKEGATIMLTASVNPSNATNKQISWSSKNESIATVDDLNNSGDSAQSSAEQKARVVAIREGRVQIVASAEGGPSGTVEATCDVIIRK